ncbi:DALR anticodon binding domain protein, partial [Cooperia oncophora]
MMITLVDDLKKTKLDRFREEEGRLLYFPEKCEVPLTIVKSDGGYTYDTSDLAALRYRLHEKKADWVTVFAAARELGWYEDSRQRVEHVAFGLVLGEDRKKFKTRSGETVRLLDLLDEGVKRAAAKLEEKGRAEVMNEAELAAARDAVAYGCIKYADLSHTRTQDLCVFIAYGCSDDKGNTAVYLLYAYARIRSIVRTSGVAAEDLNDFIASNPTIPITHPAELTLAKQILKLADCILQVLDSLMLHQLCDYLYQLATIFHDFYSACYVIEKKS